MNNKKIIKLFIIINTILFWVVLYEIKVVSLENNDLSSSKTNCEIIVPSFYEGSTKFNYCPSGYCGYVKITFKDDSMNCKFVHLPESEFEQNFKKRLFAVLIDSKKGPLEYQFLNNLECDFNAPKSSDFLTIHIYCQNEEEENFVMHRKNFICKFKFMSADENTFFSKKFGKIFYKYTKNDIKIGGENNFANLWQKPTPNLYTLGVRNKSSIDHFAIIDLPNGKNEEIPYEDRVFPLCLFKTNTTANNVMPNTSAQEDKPYAISYFNFKVPEGIKEFDVLIYKSVFCNCLYKGDDDKIKDHDRFVEKYKINLN